MSFQLQPQPGQAYLAIEGLEHLLVEELAGHPYTRYERLFVVGTARESTLYWYENCWEELYRIDFSSISTGAKALRSLQRSWWPYLWQQYRRGTLLQEALPHVSADPLSFGGVPLSSALGSWTLLSPQEMLASPRCASTRPQGRWDFVEDKLGPPSRAYLKLWEVFTRFAQQPQAGDLCLDLGASPGGWTWVLERLGAQIIAVDRSPLREDLMHSPRVEFRRGDAFGVSPAQLDAAQWLFCDVICYPHKLYDFIVAKVMPSSLKHAVCTLKFQGNSDQRGLIAQFAALPQSMVVHLSANKHELTWILTR